MGRQKQSRKETPAWEQARAKISQGPLFRLAWYVHVFRDPKRPLGGTA